VYKAIVVGTDGSETASKAVSKAATIARKMGARLHVVTAYGAKSDDISEEMPEELEWMASAGVRADVILQRATADVDGGDLDIEVHASVGDPASVLIDVAAEVNADLIVVGNKGMTGLARFLLGSVPNKVAHHAPCDVLIVRTT
jgi:nucleotide-binding universal stress UspA family protein